MATASTNNPGTRSFESSRGKAVAVASGISVGVGGPPLSAS